MNIENVLRDMLAAASNAAQNDWKRMSGFAEKEFRTLAEGSVLLEREFREDMAAAIIIMDDANREKAIRTAQRTLKEGLDGIVLAAQVALEVAAADVKFAVQNAVNAAIHVLRAAINQSIGLTLL